MKKKRPLSGLASKKCDSLQQMQMAGMGRCHEGREHTLALTRRHLTNKHIRLMQQV